MVSEKGILRTHKFEVDLGYNSRRPHWAPFSLAENIYHGEDTVLETFL